MLVRNKVDHGEIRGQDGKWIVSKYKFGISSSEHLVWATRQFINVLYDIGELII